MRTVRIEAWTVASLLMSGTWLIVLAQAPQPSPPKPSSSPPASSEFPPAATPPADSLEKILAAALQNNPDLVIAEARLREAEAELTRARVQLVQKVINLHASLESQRRLVHQLEQSAAAARHRHEAGQIPVPELLTATTALEKAKAELSAGQAEMQALQGTAHLPESLLQLINARLRISDGRSSSTTNLLAPRDLPPKSGPPENTFLNNRYPLSKEMEARVRKFLDSPATNEKLIEDQPLRDILEFLADRQEIDFPIRYLSRELRDKPVTLPRGKLPIGAVLLAIEDSLQPSTRIIIREYGLAFVLRENLPENAILLRDFWPAKK